MAHKMLQVIESNQKSAATGCLLHIVRPCKSQGKQQLKYRGLDKMKADCCVKKCSTFKDSNKQKISGHVHENLENLFQCLVLIKKKMKEGFHKMFFMWSYF